MVALQRKVQTVRTVDRQLDRKTGLAQTLPEIVTGLCLVFNDQYLHLPGS